MVTEETTAFI